MANPSNVPPTTPPPSDDQQGELQEKDFIQERYSKDPTTFWFWLAIIAIIAALLWGGRTWYLDWMEQKVTNDPFLQVTNREFSQFLWQFPEHMRVNASQKNGYLPGFQYENKVTLVLATTEDYVIAPPELLFLYHTWHRLLSKYYYPRPIPIEDFLKFLQYANEWQPENWPKASQEYADFVNRIGQTKVSDLQSLPMTTLPLEVRQAFQGWTNFFKEGDQINEVKISFAQMEEFLKESPKYARNYWRNIVMGTRPKYLQFVYTDPTQQIPEDELAPFLKVALYNYQKSQAS